MKVYEVKRKEFKDFTNPLHHRCNEDKRREEILRAKNILALEILNRALRQGVQVDNPLVDSSYAKLNFIKEAQVLGMPVITCIANNDRIWNFKGKRKTLGGTYEMLSKVHHSTHGYYGKIQIH